YVASISATPTYVGVQVSFGFVRVVTPATLTRDALAMDMSPYRAQNSSGFQPDKLQFVRHHQYG
ncbi:MAG: hypothetical protein J6J97_05300, partial [Akkermansia sp.]|nr:hypothetical protein [Akkermansia sp.]